MSMLDDDLNKLEEEKNGEGYLIFTLGEEEYGIEILKVQEIRGYEQVTRIANTLTLLKASPTCVASLFRSSICALNFPMKTWFTTTTPLSSLLT